MSVPYPYSKKNATFWVNKCIKESKKRMKTEIRLVIDIDGEVIGAVDLFKNEGHKAETGFWLAKKCWNKCIMTNAVKLLADYGFMKLKLRRISGLCATWNEGSARVMEKAGFKYEGTLRKYASYNGKLVDMHLFAKVR